MRALGAWLASSCQTLVAFPLSRAAQFQEPRIEEIKELNAALSIQKNNPNSGLRYINLSIENNLSIYVWVDGSLANNKDLTLQIGFIISVGNETRKHNSFTFHGNTIHWSSTKCKRVTRSILTSELYAMTQGIDITIPLCVSMNQIMAQLKRAKAPLIICTNSLSLYECLVKLGTTKEKCLMIDIMAIFKSYERRELAEIRWIHGTDNPADAMTKIKTTTALQRLLDFNELKCRLQG